MVEITKIMHTETGHRLTSYPHKCAHFHGHSYKWEVTVTAEELDAVGFVMDYKDLKEVMLSSIDNLDHAFIMHREDPLVREYGSQQVREMLAATNGEMGRLFIMFFNPTSENIIAWQADIIQDLLPEGVKLKHIRLWETAGSFCDWSAADE